jgi:hypothetical protein
MKQVVATWTSKDTTKPYYGKEVTTDSSGKVVGANTGNSKTTITYTVSPSGTKTYTTPSGLQTTNEAQAVNTTLKDVGASNRAATPAAPINLGQAALNLVGLSKPSQPPTMASANDYTVNIGGKSMKVSPALAVQINANKERIYTTPQGATSSENIYLHSQGTLTEAKNIPHGFLAKGISAMKSQAAATGEYAGGVITSFDQDNILSPALNGLALRSKQREIEAKTMQLNLKFSGDTSFSSKAQQAILGASARTNREFGNLYQKPGTYAFIGGTAYLTGLGVGALFSGGEGALTVAAQGWSAKAQTASLLGIAGAKGFMGGALISGTLLSARSEYQRQGTIGETVTATGFGILGAARGAGLFKVEKSYTNLEKMGSESDLKILTGESNVKAGSTEWIKSQDIISRDVLKFGEIDLMKSKKYDIIEREARVTGVFDKGTSERIINAKQTTTTFIEKNNAAKMVGLPKVEESLISVVDFSAKTTRPAIIKFDTLGKINDMLPALKETPTIYSAFETRTAEGDIISGVQKSYIFKSPKTSQTISLEKGLSADVLLEGGPESYLVKSRTYVLPKEKALKGYELTTKKGMDVFVGPSEGGWGLVTKESITDLTAKEGIIKILAKGGTAKVFESKGLYIKFASITKTFDFSKTVKLDKELSATISGKKATYNIDLFKGKTSTQEKGTITSDRLVNLFRRAYPKSKAKIAVIPEVKFKPQAAKGDFNILPPSAKSTPELRIITEQPSTSARTTSRLVTKSRTSTLGTQSIMDAVFESQKETTILKMGTVALPTYRLGSQQRMRSLTAVSQAMRQSQVSITGMKTTELMRTEQAVTFVPKYAIITKQTTIGQSQSITGFGNNVRIDIPPPPTPAPFGFPSLGLGLQMFSSGGGGARFKSKRNASIAASVFNIKGKWSKFAEVSGLGIRPLMR